jgi:Leucine-rich repeat (LRR) protein
MDEQTKIDSVGFMISSPRNDTIKGLIFEHNTKINYLPENTGEKFPNLVGFSAYDAQLKAISKANFQNLIHLEELHLSNNQIQIINSDTFEGLISLEHIFLGLFVNSS